MVAGGVNRHIINNTIYDVDAGINVAASNGTLEIADNIIANVTVPASNHVFIENSGLAGNTSFHHNLLQGDARLRWGGGQIHPTAAQLALVNSLNVDPQFLNPPGQDFHLRLTSQAINAGDTNAVYATFLARYGVSIAADADGMTLLRVFEASWSEEKDTCRG